MLSILYGLGSAVSWGTGDFAGGFNSRRIGSYRASFYGELAGLVLLLAGVAVFGEAIPAGWTLAWGAAAGAFGGLGMMILYRSLSEGKMSIAGPISALMATLLPVIAAAFTEGLTGIAKYIGFTLALLAIWLVSRHEDSPKEWHLHLADLRLPLLAGACFGAYFILMNRGSQEATLWPIIAGRAAGTLLVFFFAAARGQIGFPAARAWPLVALNAVGDVGGNIFFVLAGQAGRLDVASVVSSLYPGMTVLLAATILHERLTRSQWIGVALALAAIVLMTV
jgi:drug/metabolite transporter (DMT)-like permease